MRQNRLVAVVVVALALAWTSGAPTDAGAGSAYAAPPRLPPASPATLGARYAATAAAVDRARSVAEGSGDRERAAALAALARPGRQLYAFDPRGDGMAVEVIGDLATARRIAVLVPGSDTDLETFDAHGDAPWAAPGGGARALAAATRSLDPGARIAVVAWLGYDTPRIRSAEVLTDRSAVEGARRLRVAVTELRRIAGAQVSLLCHSYGAVVCSEAGTADVTDVALYGSPGLGAATAGAAFGHETRVWAGRGSGDWTRWIPHVRVEALGSAVGFGPDPLSAVGTRVFDAGDGGHSAYLAPGTVALRNLASIALGGVPRRGTP